MGTNYYWREEPCGSCGRADEMHVGKSSVGWVFVWQGYRDHDEKPFAPLDTAQAWLDFLRRGVGSVWDEYGVRQDVEKFIALVESKRDRRSRLDPEAQSAFAPGTWPPRNTVSDPLGDDVIFEDFS